MEIYLTSNRDSILDCIFTDNKQSWTPTDLDTLTLSDRVGIGSLMYPEYFPSLIDDIPWFFRESFFEEFLHRNLPDKAEPLRVLTISIWQFCLFCDLSDFRFFEISDREYCLG